MEPTPRPQAPAARIRLAVLRDPRDAERYRDGLEAAGIDARVEIDDAQRALPGESLLPGLIGGGQPLFVYPLSIPADERTRAASVLIDLGWDGRRGGRRTVAMAPGALLRGALLALAAGAAVAALRMVMP